ncbi:MAG TPA: 2Fe-2S ferredoxin [Acidimicrobiaceae bacterium]|nr:2Fe-2S ferredoxin [Acidimicrobiaceae bacterium]
MSRTVQLCAADDVPDGEARRFDVEGHRIAVIRIGEQFYALGDRCSHANYSLSEGWVWPDDCSLECPQHSSRFSLVTGEPSVLPATEPVPVYAIRRVGPDGEQVELTLPATPDAP